ncbi:STY4534 family ICE replication protein [Pseudomonas sp. MWU12-2037]|uniref:STY4534 family ICE replication protein n=1 Tax=Pseudomonas sp. MWU12-2037 TaxID=2928690 RepID=UPI00200EA55E|nr:STY4534 family ICE replication protein [Pseudomonas sp. MWU12-2037]
MSQSSAVTDVTYFDLHTSGLGYLNRIREVKPNRGKPFLACTIAALCGPTESPDYRYFDVTVSGSEAQHLVSRCAEAVREGRKVLIGFRLGDMWTGLFRYQRGEKAGQTGVTLKARLLFISWIKIDGQQVYQAKPRSNDEHAVEAQSPEISDTTEAFTCESPAVAESF